MTDKRPTISDVATRSGVSKATVSAVLNDSASVRSDTRERVLAAVELLNYRPAHLARSRGLNGQRCMALLIKEHDNPYYDDVTAGVRAHADKDGYVLLVVSSEGGYSAERRAVELLRDRGVDGLIAAPVLDEDTDLSHFFELKRRRFPFVLLEEIRGVPASLVDVENTRASQEAVEYLFSLGHRRVAHFGGPAYSAHSQDRLDGVRHAYSATDLVFLPEDMVQAGAHFADGYRCATELFTAREPEHRPTAVTCYNDLVAMGVCRALADLEIRCPEDVSVIGFDDITFCEHFLVPLTSVRVPKFEMGRTAAQLLVQQIESKRSLPSSKVYLEAEIVVRRSTAPPPRQTITRSAKPARSGSGAIDLNSEDSSISRPVLAL